MNDKTPKGDGNISAIYLIISIDITVMNDKTPKGDGNCDEQY